MFGAEGLDAEANACWWVLDADQGGLWDHGAETGDGLLVIGACQDARLFPCLACALQIGRQFHGMDEKATADLVRCKTRQCQCQFHFFLRHLLKQCSVHFCPSNADAMVQDGKFRRLGG